MNRRLLALLPALVALLVAPAGASAALDIGPPTALTPDGSRLGDATTAVDDNGNVAVLRRTGTDLSGAIGPLSGTALPLAPLESNVLDAQVAISPDGNAAAAWTVSPPGQSQQVAVATRTPGGSFGEPVRFPLPAGAQLLGSLAVDVANGGATAVSWVTSEAGTRQYIVRRRSGSEPFGEPMTTQVQVAFGRAPTLSVASGGGVVAVVDAYQDDDLDDDKATLVAITASANATTLGAPARIDDVDDVRYSDVATAPDGSVAVAWAGKAAKRATIGWARVTSEGKITRRRTRRSKTTTDVKIAIGGRENSATLLAWREARHVRALLVRSDTGASRVGSYGKGFPPKVAVNSEGAATVVWDDKRTSWIVQGSASGFTAKARRLDGESYIADVIASGRGTYLLRVGFDDEAGRLSVLEIPRRGKLGKAVLVRQLEQRGSAQLDSARLVATPNGRVAAFWNENRADGGIFGATIAKP